MRIKRPFPGLIATLWGEPERYVADYWEQIPGGYYVGDAAHIDEDGYVWFAGRADEIIKIADHRLGTIEVETAFLRHPAVAEAGVTGVPDELRGEVIEAFVALKAGHEPSDELHRELLQTVRHELGPVAVIGHLSIVAMLPKTRSGKIMRRVLKAVALEPRPRRHQHDRGRGLGRRGPPRGRGDAGRHHRLTAAGPAASTRSSSTSSAPCCLSRRWTRPATGSRRGAAAEIAARWRARQLEASWLRTAMERWAVTLAVAKVWPGAAVGPPARSGELGRRGGEPRCRHRVDRGLRAVPPGAGRAAAEDPAGCVDNHPWRRVGRGFAYVVADAGRTRRQRRQHRVFPALLGVVYAIAVAVGMFRYR